MYIPDQAFLHKIAYIFIYSTTSNDFLFYFLIFLRCSKILYNVFYILQFIIMKKRKSRHILKSHISMLF